MSFRKMLLLVFLAGTFVSAQSNSIDGLHSPANALGLPPNIIHPRDYPSLSDKEIGHIRRMIELANLPPGEWGGMGSNWFEMPERTLGYQLEFMTYALASAQYNVTPAYHDVYRDTMDKFIQKLLLPDVWRSWANVSRGGELMDPDQKAMREGWIDPVRKDNVMYSGHVLEMTALYEVLYRTGKYDKPGSISFRFSESTWGPGPQVYKYDVHSMAKLLHDEFQESDYVGIACEPNLIFTACNQLPVLGFILHDYLYGTHYAAEVIPKFKAKWVSEHYVDPQTQSVMAFRMKTQQKNIYGSSAWQDGWAGMFMHAWDPTYIESIYPAQKQNHLPILFGHSDVAGGQFEERLGLAFFAALASEVGDTALVKQALESVDRDWTPQWDGEGAYYYPRNDELRRGETGIVRMVEPLASNALIPFARLNRSNGLLNLHQHPWGEEHFREPYVTGIDYASAAVSQAFYDSGKDALILTIVPRPGKADKVEFRIEQLDVTEAYEVFRNDESLGKIRRGDLLDGGAVEWRNDGTLLIRTTAHDRTSLVLRGTKGTEATAAVVTHESNNSGALYTSRRR